MNAKTILALAILGSSVLVHNPARAEEQTGIGVGVENMLTSEFDIFGWTPGVATVTYDAGLYRLSGLLALVTWEDQMTYVGIGGRFYYPLHKRHDSDFSVGGGLAVLNANPDAGESDTSLHVEAGVQLRAFITGNVALSATLGLGVLLADDDGPAPDDTAFGILGQLVGGLGISYFFW